MANENSRDEVGKITISDADTLAARSVSLVSRGLRTVSAWDATRILELGKALVSGRSETDVLRTITEKINELLRPSVWSLLRMDEEKKELYFEITTGDDAQALTNVRVKIGEGIAGSVAQTGKMAVLSDARKDSRFLAHVDGRPKIEVRSIVAVPLAFQNECLGVIELINYASPDGFLQSDLFLLQALADFAAIAIRNARHVSRIHELTITDDCTTLYNARHLNFMLDTEIYRSERYNYEFALLCVVFTGLRDLTETLSFAAFNSLLADIGQKIKASCRLIDFAFRYADGEFFVLLPQTSKESACAFARHLHKTLKEIIVRTDGKRLPLSVKTGVALFPEDGKTKATLLHSLDETMRLIKTGDGVAAANLGILQCP